MAISRIKEDQQHISGIIDENFIFKNSNHGTIFNETTASRGDITKTEGYRTLKETVAVLDRMLSNLNNNTYTTYIETVKNAHKALLENKALFGRAFDEGRTTVKLFYGSLAASLNLVVTNGCSAALENYDNNTIDFKKPSLLARFKEITELEVFKNINRYLTILKNNTLRDIMDEDMDKEVESPIVQESTVLGFTLGIAALVTITYLIRLTVQFFFSFRTKLSEWTSVQADYLELNQRLIDDPKIKAKQLGYAAKLRKISTRVDIETKIANETISKSTDVASNGSSIPNSFV